MLKILIVAGLVAIALFLLACLLLAGIMLVIVFTTPKEEAPLAVRRRTSDIEPPLDDALFRRLLNEAMAYATRPFVTTIVDVSGIFLLITVSDVFGRLTYAESRRRESKTLHAVICVYEGWGERPSAMAATEIPASHVDWPDYFATMKDIQADGPKMSYVDQRGQRREIRIPKGGRHHA